MRIASIDLAYRKYRDFGFVLLEDTGTAARYKIIPFSQHSKETPTPKKTADFIIDVCKEQDIQLVLLDGPQCWKNPDNGLEHARISERYLNTPGKTGPHRSSKPRNYLPFIAFSIEVFEELHDRGWSRFDPDKWSPDKPTAVETFPYAAWKSLNFPHLRSKRKGAKDVAKQMNLLVDGGLIEPGEEPTHDELQAIVAGLAGLGMLGSKLFNYEITGVAPFLQQGVWMGGYIVTPKIRTISD